MPILERLSSTLRYFSEAIFGLQFAACFINDNLLAFSTNGSKALAFDLSIASYTLAFLLNSVVFVCFIFSNSLISLFEKLPFCRKIFLNCEFVTSPNTDIFSSILFDEESVFFSNNLSSSSSTFSMVFFTIMCAFAMSIKSSWNDATFLSHL